MKKWKIARDTFFREEDEIFDNPFLKYSADDERYLYVCARVAGLWLCPKVDTFDYVLPQDKYGNVLPESMGETPRNSYLSIVKMSLLIFGKDSVFKQFDHLLSDQS